MIRVRVAYRSAGIDNLIQYTSEEAPELSGQTVKELLAIQEKLSVYDLPKNNVVAIEPLPLTNLDESTRRLLEMLFFEKQPLKEVRRVALASGIKAKNLKPLLVNAVLSLA